MKFSDIPQLTRPAHYQVNQSWRNLKETIRHYQGEHRTCALDINPDFQRGHVWTKKQQIAYVEFMLKGGTGSNILTFNCIGWMGSFKGPFVLVDGKQRLTAALKFLDNKLPIFGENYYKDFEDKLYSGIDFIFAINNLDNMNDVYKWYVELNSGGTPHKKSEIDKVKAMIK